MKLWVAPSVLWLTLAVASGQSDPSPSLEDLQKDLAANPGNSWTHYRLGQLHFLRRNYIEAGNQFREALNGDLQPQAVAIWSHIALAGIFDATGQRDRAVNE